MSKRNEIGALIYKAVSTVLDENRGIKRPELLVNESVRLINASTLPEIEKLKADLIWDAAENAVTRQLRIRRVDHYNEDLNQLWTPDLLDMYIPSLMTAKALRELNKKFAIHDDIDSDEENGDKEEGDEVRIVKTVSKVRDATLQIITVQFRERQIVNVRNANRSFDKWERRRDAVQKDWALHPEDTFEEILKRLGLIPKGSKSAP